MKLVNEPRNRGGATPSAGCVCYNESNHTNTRGLWRPIFNCKCGCINHDNRMANREDARTS